MAFALIVDVLLIMLCTLPLIRLEAQEEMDKPPTEPEVISVFPLGGRRGDSLHVEIRGRTLGGVYAAWFDSAGLKAQVKKVEEIELEPTKGYQAEAQKRRRGHRVWLQVEIGSDAKFGTHSLRLVSPRGISNVLPFLVTSDPVIAEEDIQHDTPGAAQPVQIPVVINGRISRPGESDYYAFEVSAGQELTFEVISKPEALSFAGAGGFDPQVALYEPAGSWFDPRRVIRLAFNDEPISENVGTNPRLTYRFHKANRYLAQVGSYLGKGGPNCAYQLRIVPANRPINSENEKTRSSWSERSFTRKIDPNRLTALRARTAGTTLTEDTFPSVVEKEPNESCNQATEVRPLTLIEGAIQGPGDIDSFRFHVEPGQQLAFELETPNAAPPEFSPVLGILDASGSEFLTNIYKRIGRNFTFYLKTVEPKTVYKFELGGDYCMQIRDVTSRYGSPSFIYRLLIRPQIPHVGELQVKEDRINLGVGQTRKLTITTGQEEGFSGDIVLSVQGLPLGVEALPGTQVEPDKGPALDEGQKERFVPKAEKAIVMLVAGQNASVTLMPQSIRIVGRASVGGKLGAPLTVRELPLMVVKPQ